MPYVLPTFNLPYNCWHFGNPTSNPPDFSSVCNLTPGRRNFAAGNRAPGDADWFIPMWLLLPINDDVRGEYDTGGLGDTVEVPGGSGRMYSVRLVDFIGLGFANQHRFAVITGKPPFPYPYPPPFAGYLELEDLTNYLLEDTTPILLE